MNDKLTKWLPNFELFQRVVCRVLVQSQAAFPNTIDISCTALAHEIMLLLDDCTKSSIDLAIEISAVISWLEKAGYIWVGGHELNDYFDVTLSQQGLAKLLSEVDGVTLAEKLCTANTIQSQSEAIKRLIQD